MIFNSVRGDKLGGGGGCTLGLTVRIIPNKGEISKSEEDKLTWQKIMAWAMVMAP